MLAKDLNGHSVLTAYAPIEPAREQAARGGPASTLGWKVFVEQPVAEVYAALDATIVRTVALIVAGLLFSAWPRCTWHAAWSARSVPCRRVRSASAPATSKARSTSVPATS